MAGHVAFLPASIRDAIQTNTISRMLLEPLVPHNLYREGVPTEKWVEGTGEQKFITRSGKMPVVTRAGTPRQDPTPQYTPFEQFEILAEPLHGSTEIDARQAFHTAFKETRRNLSGLGLQAGTSVARWCRNKLFQAYLGGDTWLTAQANAGASTLAVQSIAGFRKTFTSSGRLSDVSASNPLSVVIGADAETVSVIGATPTSALKPNGAGTLLLAAVLTGTHAIYSRVLSEIAPKILRVGTATTTRGIGATDVLTLAYVDSAVATLQQYGVQPFADGMYRCHLSPEAVRQIRQDNAWQRQLQSTPDHMRVTNFEVGVIGSVLFVSNQEAPSKSTVQSDEDFPGAVTSTQTGGQNICRTFVVGADAIEEHYVPELEFEQYPSSAQWGQKGDAARWVEADDGYFRGLLKGIHFYIRHPQDAKGERATVTWSWTGDFGIPTDHLAGGSADAAYRRGVVIEHADLLG